jgi:hypothetical protein
MPRVGECIVADGGPPCQRQPLRGRPVPSGGADPSTWLVVLGGDRRDWPLHNVPKRHSLLLSMFLSRRLAPRAPHSLVVRGGRIRHFAQSGQGEFLNQTGFAMQSRPSSSLPTSSVASKASLANLFRLVGRHLRFDIPPKCGDIDFHFRQSQRLITVVGRGLHDKLSVFIDQELDHLRFWLHDPVLADTVPRI